MAKRKLHGAFQGWRQPDPRDLSVATEKIVACPMRRHLEKIPELNLGINILELVCRAAMVVENQAARLVTSATVEVAPAALSVTEPDLS